MHYLMRVMTSFIVRMPIFLILLGGMSGCGGGGGGGGDGDGDDPDNSNNTPEAVKEVISLSGTWNSSCNKSDQATTFEIDTFIKEATGTRFTLLTKKFVDSTCTTLTEKNSIETFKGDIRIGGEINTEEGTLAREIDLLITERNGRSGEVILYDLVYIDPAKPDQLFFGLITDVLDRSGVDKRSNLINFDKSFFRQPDNTSAEGGTAGSTPLSGSWQSSCIEVSTEKYQIYSHNFFANSFSSQTNTFSDNNCTTPFESNAELIISGTFNVGGQIVTSDGITAREWDSHTTRANDIETDIKHYDVFYIDPAKPDELFLGIESEGRDGHSVDKRKIKLDFNVLFNRLK